MKRTFKNIILHKFVHLATVILCSLNLSNCGGSTEESSDANIGDDIPIAYIQRQVPLDEDDQTRFIDRHEPYDFFPGAALMLKNRASPTADEVNITANVFPVGELYDVKDLEVSFDGKKLLFAMRAPELPNVDPELQPKWNIWEYNRENKVLRRVIASNLQAEAGQDFAPAYLPDGRIVFSSTRQREINAIRLNEDKPQYSALAEAGNSQAAVLHVMNDDGTNIQQITFNQSHDVDASVLNDGRIIFTRMNAGGGNDQMDLYTVNPDGTNLQFLYGSDSHNTGTDMTPVQFFKPVQQPNGLILAQVTPYDLTTYGSNWFFIDTHNFIDYDIPVFSTNNLTTTQTPLFPSIIPTENTLSPNGRYLDVTSLNDNTNRFLVTWNSCRIRIPNSTPNVNELGLLCTAGNLAQTNVVEANPNSGVWVYDPSSSTQKPITLAPLGTFITEVSPLIKRPTPKFIADKTTDDAFGFITIDSVYDLDGVDTSPNGINILRDPKLSNYNLAPIRFIRLTKGVGIPDDDTRRISGASFGPGNRFMKEILGYAPVEPDGSVSIKVPANVPIMLDLVNAEGQAARLRHSTWMLVRPGETIHCTGCHDDNNMVISNNGHGRAGFELPRVNLGAPVSGQAFANTDPTLLPILGEVMAKTRSRLKTPRTLTPDLVYEDDWTDPSQTTVANSINIRFKNLTDPTLSLETAIPASETCLANWTEYCRIVINYEQHIQPIWSKPRQVLDTDGVTVLEEHTCTFCHNRVDALGLIQIPAGQLELTDQSSDLEPRQLISYTDLLLEDFEQEIVDDILQDRTLEEPALDEFGNPILDANNQPIIDLVQFPIAPTMSGAGSINSNAFFTKFTNDVNDVNHYQRLSTIELKLLREWLDIGAQNYNNPFDAPEI